VIGWRAGATDPSLITATTGSRSLQKLVRTRPVCKYRVRNSRMGLWPSGRSHAHFAEREQKFGELRAVDRILGMTSQAKISSLEFETRWQLASGIPDVICMRETCDQCSNMDGGKKHRVLAFYSSFSMRICHVFQISNCLKIW